jgi:hypothetical protein
MDKYMQHPLAGAISGFNIASLANMSICDVVVKNRSNDFLEFLIILNDEHYKRGIFGGASEYDRLIEQKFPGELVILHKNELKSEENRGNYIIEGNVMCKKLYIKLPKENMYVDANKYQEKYINSNINEFIRIVSTLNASSIVFKLQNESDDQFGFQMGSNVKVATVSGGLQAGMSEQNHTSGQNVWELTFEDTKRDIDIQVFGDKKRFYYLPKNSEWMDVIRNRVTYGAKEAKYVYEYVDSTDVSADFLAKLKLLNIEVEFNKSKYEKLRVEYEIKYYPTQEEPTGWTFSSITRALRGL